MYRDNINRDWEWDRDTFSLSLALSHHNYKVREIDTEDKIFWKHVCVCVCVCVWVFSLNLVEYLYFHVYILLFHERWNSSVNNGSLGSYEYGLCRGWVGASFTVKREEGRDGCMGRCFVLRPRLSQTRTDVRVCDRPLDFEKKSPHTAACTIFIFSLSFFPFPGWHPFIFSISFYLFFFSPSSLLFLSFPPLTTWNNWPVFWKSNIKATCVWFWKSKFSVSTGFGSWENRSDEQNGWGGWEWG